MITGYRNMPDGGVESFTMEGGPVPPDVIWIDANCPDDDELRWLRAFAGFDVPDRHDMTEIELSSRLYKAGDAYVMIANLLPKSATEILPPHPAAFILKREVILTVHHRDFFSFERMAGDILRQRERRTPQSVFCQILDEAVSDRADDLEFAMRRMEELTSRMFKGMPHGDSKAMRDEPKLDEAMHRLGGMGERVANVRESIASLQRVLNYARTYVPQEWMGPAQEAIMDSMRTDLVALSDEAAFFMNKLSFNLDATLGMINIEETKIIRLLSIVTLLLSPPTLVAGIYGMNFQIMPELEWPFGYFFALALMIGSSVASIWYLRKKKWL